MEGRLCANVCSALTGDITLFQSKSNIFNPLQWMYYNLQYYIITSKFHAIQICHHRFEEQAFRIFEMFLQFLRACLKKKGGVW